MIGKQQQHHGEEELTVDPVEQQQRPTDPEGMSKALSLCAGVICCSF